MRKNIIFYVISIVILFVSCNYSEKDQLQRIDKMLDCNQIELAKKELVQLKYCELTSDRSKAHYVFQKLKLSSHSKTSPIPDSSLVQQSVDYFWQNSRLDLLTDTYFYLGSAEFERGFYEKAFSHFENADLYSVKLHDQTRSNIIHQKICALNNKCNYSQNPDIQKRVFAIQKTFIVQSAYENKFCNLRDAGLSILIVLCFLVSFYYSLNKKNMGKLSLAQVRKTLLINNYESRIRNLEVSSQKQLASFEKQKNELLESQMNLLALGKDLYFNIENGGTTAKWNKKNFEEYIEYYKLVDASFLMALEKEYSVLTPQNVFYEILCHKQIPESDILRILCKSEGALRTMKSRLRAKRK